MLQHTAIYMRVSSKAQDHRSQEPDLQRWAAAQDGPIVWYRDKATGKHFVRPDWQKLEEAMRMCRVTRVVVWRLDRLGRTAKGLTELFEELCNRKINFISLKDGVDLSTAAGRLMANVLASVAQYETEVRGERILAGQAVARAKGKTWGGSEPGVRKTVTPEQERAVLQLHAERCYVARIAKAVNLSRPTVYDILHAHGALCKMA